MHCLRIFYYVFESFPNKESDTQILQNIHFAYYVGIVSCYSNRPSCSNSIFVVLN